MPEILTPEDVYGDEFECPECESIGYGDVCEECGYDSDDEFVEPEPNDDIDDGPWA